MGKTSALGWTIRIALLQSGERLPLLVRAPFGLPDPEISEFVITQLRPKGRAVSTMSAYLSAIGAALSHFERAGIRLEERVATGTYFSTQEMTAFASFCKRGKHRLVIAPNEAAARYARFLDYVQWSAASFICRASSDIGLDRAQKALRRFELRAAAVAPTPANPLPSPDVGKGFVAAQRELLETVIRPGDERNPWKKPGVRYRNFAMISLATELGPRAGDVLSLKIRDIGLSHRPATVTFHRRHDDPEDSRRDQPVLKTKPRVLEISDALARTLERWIDRERSDRSAFPAARTHPFVFTNNRGDPLGKRGYQLVFQELRTKFPELGPLVSHVFRHDWNERFTEMESAEGRDSANSVREQCYAMGWADRSTMPSRYARRAIAASANKKITRMNESAQKRGEKHRQKGNSDG